MKKFLAIISMAVMLVAAMLSGCSGEQPPTAPACGRARCGASDRLVGDEIEPFFPREVEVGDEHEGRVV